MSNPLLSTTKASDSPLRITLHPLVLLTISDYVTRHTLRQHKAPLLGALLGQQTGRDISLEHAFEIKTKSDNPLAIDQPWFEERLTQYAQVHKEPQLSLVGWFTTVGADGPQEQHVVFHRQLMAHVEPGLLVAFHGNKAVGGDAGGTKLPVTIYEGVLEEGIAGDSLKPPAGQDAEMEGVEQQPAEEEATGVKFREVAYTVETGEAEMIAVDFVAKGGGNATAVNASSGKDKGSQVAGSGPSTSKSVGGGTKEVNGVVNGVGSDSVSLSPEEEELIAALTTRANAVKMLHSRIAHLKSYLVALPPSYLNTPQSTDAPSTDPSISPPAESPSSPTPQAQISHPLLRSIKALTTHIPLLIPPDKTLFEQELLAEKSDTQLVALLGGMGNSLGEMKTLGRKFATIDASRADKRRGGGSERFGGGFGGNGMLMDEGVGMGGGRAGLGGSFGGNSAGSLGGRARAWSGGFGGSENGERSGNGEGDADEDWGAEMEF